MEATFSFVFHSKTYTDFPNGGLKLRWSDDS